MTPRKASSTRGPSSATTGAMRAKTATGASFMMNPVRAYMASARLSHTASRGKPFSPMSRMAPPRHRAKKMIWSILPSARAATGLVGTIFSRVSATLTVVPAAPADSCATWPSPRPTGKRLAASRPSVTASAVVHR